MNISNILTVFLIALLAILFSISNKTSVSIQLFSFSSLPMPLYVPIFVAFVMGFLGGIVALSFSRHKHKQEIARLRKEKLLLQQELDNLRNIPLQEDL